MAWDWHKSARGFHFLPGHTSRRTHFQEDTLGASRAVAQRVGAKLQGFVPPFIVSLGQF